MIISRIRPRAGRALAIRPTRLQPFRAIPRRTQLLAASRNENALATTLTGSIYCWLYGYDKSDDDEYYEDKYRSIIDECEGLSLKDCERVIKDYDLRGKTEKTVTIRGLQFGVAEGRRMQRMLKIPEASATAIRAKEFRSMLDMVLNKMPIPSEKYESADIALAVSGGPDSMALAAMACQVIPAERLVALTIDHGLQSHGVTENSHLVSQYLARLGIKRHRVLPLDWTQVYREGLTKGKLQEMARDMRYLALFKECKRIRSPLLLTAHNLDDDIVTMFQRLAHQSGIDGLGGMKEIIPFPVQGQMSSGNFFLGRPLLQVPKARLLATCEAAGVDCIRDLSNSDLTFRRNGVLSALCQAQESSPGLSTAALEHTLRNVKRFREDLTRELMSVFERSVIINKVNGDATLILNDATWIYNKPMALRIITWLLQYASASRYPASTPSAERIYENMAEAFGRWEKEKKHLAQQVSSQLQPIDLTRRIKTTQMTLGNATFYPLSRTDAMRRIALQERLENRKMVYGPAYLIQSQPPGRLGRVSASSTVEVKLNPKQPYLWDGRFHISWEPYATLANSGESQINPVNSPRTFQIGHLCTESVKQFEALTRGSTALRRRLYSYMAITPGTHLYQIPVVRELSDDPEKPTYMAFPTLNTEYPPGRYKWRTSYAGVPILTSRFLSYS